MTADPFDLTRFVEAQAGVHEGALAELVAGRKRTHWMWFVFPQLRGLGASAMADRYGIGSLAEARAYLAHPVLGPRLDACTRAMLAHAGASARDILGRPDDMKFRSSMTLFDRADGREGNPFRTALEAFCGGVPDERTLELLREG
jgi:uncharacterized protein (DUF1810 family)